MMTTEQIQTTESDMTETAEQIGEVAVRVVESAKPSQQVAPSNESTAIISMIERAAKDPTVDMDKMERLLQMQERIFERQAKIEFDVSMAAAQAEMGPVARDARNQQTNSNYATLEAIAKGITPIRAKHGFSASFGNEDCPKENHYRVTCELSHNAGYSKTYRADIPIDSAGIKGMVNKTPTHAFGSTMSYGRRYLTLMIFDIATEDDDGNQAGSGEPISADQLSKILTLLEDTNSDVEKFCKWAKIDAVKFLPAARFNETVGMLHQKEQKVAS